MRPVSALRGHGRSRRCDARPDHYIPIQVRHAPPPWPGCAWRACVPAPGASANAPRGDVFA
eukprot:2414361-Prymnesium_polylepis.1